MNGFSNAAPAPGESGASVVLAGRVPGVGRVGVGGEVVDEVVDVVVAAGASVVAGDVTVVVAVGAAVVVVATSSDANEVVVDAEVAAVAAGAAASDPPAHAEATTAMVRKTAAVRIGQVWHEAGCVGGVMA